jgi:hypothetical protein
MLHVIRQIENQFTRTKSHIVPAALVISACALAIGLGLMLG